MKMSKIREACDSDSANDGLISFSQAAAAGLLAACHAIMMLVQSGAANRKTLRIFSRGIQQNLGDEYSLEEAGVSGKRVDFKNAQKTVFKCANSLCTGQLGRKASDRCKHDPNFKPTVCSECHYKSVNAMKATDGRSDHAPVVMQISKADTTIFTAARKEAKKARTVTVKHQKLEARKVLYKMTGIVAGVPRATQSLSAYFEAADSPRVADDEAGSSEAEDEDDSVDESDDEDGTETASEHKIQCDLIRELQERIKELPPSTDNATLATCVSELADALAYMHTSLEEAIAGGETVEWSLQSAELAIMEARQKAVSLDPLDPEYLLALCDEFWYQDDLHGAEDAYRRAMVLPGFDILYAQHDQDKDTSQHFATRYPHVVLPSVIHLVEGASFDSEREGQEVEDEAAHQALIAVRKADYTFLVQLNSLGGNDDLDVAMVRRLRERIMGFPSNFDISALMLGLSDMANLRGEDDKKLIAKFVNLSREIDLLWATSGEFVNEPPLDTNTPGTVRPTRGWLS